MTNIQAGIRRAFEKQRDENGFTQRKLANELDISFGYMCELLSGKRRWNEELIMKASRILGVSLSELEDKSPVQKSSPEKTPKVLKLYEDRLATLFKQDPDFAFVNVARTIDDWLKVSGRSH